MTKPKGKHPYNKLTDLKIRRLSNAGRYSDGNGLYIVVTNSGSKQWLLRKTFKGRRRDIGLGGYNIVSLSDARIEAIRMNNLVRRGIDPVLERNEKKIVTPTFEDAARQVHANNLDLWKNPKQAKQWLSALERHCFPKIGRMRINDIRSSHIVEVLLPIWTSKHVIANQVRQRMSNIFDWAKAKEFITHENPVNGIKRGLPNYQHETKHFASLSYLYISKFLNDLHESKQTPNAKLALEFLILTACRSGEVRFSAWEEIDLGERSWEIPAERMKMGKAHRIPLTSRAMDILEEIKPISGRGKLIFPSSQNWKKSMSDMTLAAVLKRMGLKYTVHGFRSTFRDWASETRNYPNDVVEMALAHTNRNKSEAAYKRGDLFEKRRELMEDWASYCTATNQNDST